MVYTFHTTTFFHSGVCNPYLAKPDLAKPKSRLVQNRLVQNPIKLTQDKRQF